MHLRLLDYVLWVTSPLLQLVMVIMLLRRGLHREYPYFFNYTILAILSEPILFFVHGSYTAYYYCYWINMGVSVIVSFAVLQEIFNEAFRPYEALRDLGVILFRWSALVIMLVGVMWAVNVGQNSDNSGEMQAIILLADRSVRLMQCGLVFFLLLFSEYLGIARRSLLFGISLGFGLFASFNMLVITGLTHRGIVSQGTLSRVNSAAYLLTVLIWFGYTARTAPARSTADAALLRSGDWNSALEDARGPAGADSLLDTMDRTVERLLYPPEESKVKITTGNG